VGDVCSKTKQIHKIVNKGPSLGSKSVSPSVAKNVAQAVPKEAAKAAKQSRPTTKLTVVMSEAETGGNSQICLVLADLS
jgi:hypothetical protein